MSTTTNKEPMFYEDINVDIDSVKENLLESLLRLPETCFFRRTPSISSEKMFETGEVLHKATYRYIEIEGIKDEVLGL